MTGRAPLRHVLAVAVRAGHGRTLPALLLAVACLVLAQIDTAPWLPIARSRDALFDFYQQLMPRERPDEPVVVVGIDSASLAEYGQWPWPRDRVAELLRRLHAAGPLAVGLDIIFAEPDRYSPALLGERLGMSPAVSSELPDPDRVLATAISAGPTVLAVAGLASALPGARQPSKPVPKLVDKGGVAPDLPSVPAALVSLPQIEQAAGGEGVVNGSALLGLTERDHGVLRRVPSVTQIGQQPFLSLPLEMARLALGKDGEVSLLSDAWGMTHIQVGAYILPTAANGEIVMHFGRASGHYYVSAAEVLAGKVETDVFRDRFVLVGFNSTGLQDRIISPLGESLPGIDIHVQVLESLLAGQALRRPAWMVWVEQAAICLVGLLLILFVPRLQPRYAALGFLVAAVALLGGGLAVFRLGSWMFDGLSPLLLLVPPFISLLGNTLIQADDRRRLAELTLQANREEAAHLAGQLEAARRIQMSLLPDPAKLFANDARFAIAARLEPALAVGGDFYDCFRLDDRRICVAIGDVSGKGLPASLFMAISKTLTSTLIRRHNDLGLALRDMETELGRQNSAFLFVTAMVVVLDVTNGELSFACAGHDAPMIRRGDHIIRLDTSEVAGPPLCAAGDYPYQGGLTQLRPGDVLCFFTDGVTEASNGHQFFGGDNLADCLLRQRTKPLAEQAEALRNEVRKFEADRPSSDDLAIVLLAWQGDPR